MPPYTISRNFTNWRRLPIRWQRPSTSKRRADAEAACLISHAAADGIRYRWRGRGWRWSAAICPFDVETRSHQGDSASVEIDFIEMDMREFDLPGRQFGLVIIAANSLLHLHDPHDIRRCFAAIARHLVPSGALAFDVFVPSVRFLAREPNQRHLVGRFMHDELGELILEETTDYDAVSQVSRATWFWSTPDQLDFFVIPLHMRLLFPQELPLLVEMGGLRLLARYGDFDRS